MKFFSFVVLTLLVGILAYYVFFPTPNAASQSRTQPVPVEENNGQHSKTDDSTLQNAYTFETPNTSVKLESTLKEISGLTFIDADRLAVVQDEKGKIYQIDAHSGEILRDDRFDKDGDYEGIEFVNGQMYVLRSDGDIFAVDGWPPESKDAKKYETILSTKYDTEGLAYDPTTNSLLVVCKEFAGDGLTNHKAIYRFDLATNEMNPKPAYVIDLNTIANLIPENPLNRAIRRLAAPLTDMSGFKPAAIAVHPITNDLFIISSVRKLLISLNRDNTVKAVWPLPDKLFRQPEGLAFLPNGDLFISNEGGKGKATLLRFNYTP